MILQVYNNMGYAIMEKIICSALYVNTGKPSPARRSYNYPQTGLVFAGWRHSDCFVTFEAWRESLDFEIMNEIREIDARGLQGGNQGFLTSTGRYVDRVEAFAIAKNAGQIASDKNEGFLTSEDIY